MALANDHLVILSAVVICTLVTALFIYFYIHFLCPGNMPIPSRSPSPPSRGPASLLESEDRTLFCGLKLSWPGRDRRRRRDEEEAVVHPPVFCVEDLEIPPPAYQRSRCQPPSDVEMRTLKQQLNILKEMRVNRFEPFEKTLHRAEIVNLDRWIKHLERLVEKRAAWAAAHAANAERAGSSSNVDSTELTRSIARVG